MHELQPAIEAGSGDDTIIVSSICDLQAGESIDGGSGSDTFESPFTSSQLVDMGINVDNIETFTVLTTGASDLMDAAWGSLDHAAEHLTIPDIELIQVIPGGNIYSPAELHVVDGYADGPNVNPNIDDFATFKGRSVSTGSLDDISSAHMFGHNFTGLGDTAHNNAEELGVISRTLMWEDVTLSTEAWFSDANATAAEDCVDESYCPVGGAWTSP